MPKFLSYGNYVYAPAIATAMWFATLLGLLLLWLVTDNSVRYQRDEAGIVFISDSGAAHKSFFIAGCAVTSFFYVSSLVLERWLRHADRLPGVERKREGWCDIAAIVFGSIGALALLLLSIFDAFNHSTLHWSFTLVFIVGIALSAIFQTAEIHFLEASHPDRAHLTRNAWIKIAVVSVAIAVAIVFGGTYAVCGGNAGEGYAAKCNTTTSVAAVCEWVVALIFDVYLATFILDLWPAAKTSPRHIRRQEKKLREKGLIAPEHGPSVLSQPSPAFHGSSTRQSGETYNSSAPLRV